MSSFTVRHSVCGAVWRCLRKMSSAELRSSSPVWRCPILKKRPRLFHGFLRRDVCMYVCMYFRREKATGIQNPMNPQVIQLKHGVISQRTRSIKLIVGVYCCLLRCGAVMLVSQQRLLALAAIVSCAACANASRPNFLIFLVDECVRLPDLPRTEHAVRLAAWAGVTGTQQLNTVLDGQIVLHHPPRPLT